MNKENPATTIRIELEEIADKLKESYIKLNGIYNRICKVEETIENG